MPSTTTDSTGASVTIDVVDEGPIRAYVVAPDGEPPVGRAEFVEPSAGERVFFHTEVDPAHGGRGLAGLLVAEALADSIRDGVVVVPVCPFFARRLRDHGDEFIAEGGRFRAPGPADEAAVARAVAAARAAR